MVFFEIIERKTLMVPDKLVSWIKVRVATFFVGKIIKFNKKRKKVYRKCYQTKKYCFFLIFWVRNERKSLNHMH